MYDPLILSLNPLYIGPLGSKQFIIKGNKKRFAATLKVLQEELSKIERRRGEVQVSESIRNLKNIKDMGVFKCRRCGEMWSSISSP